jgi:chromosome segregation ATPase
MTDEEKIIKSMNNLKEDIDNFNETNKTLISKLNVLESEILKSQVDIEKIISAGNDVDKSNSDRNEEVIKEIEDAKNYLKDTKNQIAENVVETLGIKDMTNSLEKATNEIKNASDEIENYLNENSSQIDILKTQTLNLTNAIKDIQKFVTSFNETIDYSREVEDIVKFLKANYNRKITREELFFRFDEKRVREVLEKGEKLGYWKFRF